MTLLQALWGMCMDRIHAQKVHLNATHAMLCCTTRDGRLHGLADLVLQADMVPQVDMPSRIGTPMHQPTVYLTQTPSRNLFWCTSRYQTNFPRIDRSHLPTAARACTSGHR